MEKVQRISTDLVSEIESRREAAVRAVLRLSPAEFEGVDTEALLSAVRDRPMDEVKEALVLDFEGLELPLDPEEAERMGLREEPALEGEGALASMTAALIEADEE